ncbi:chromosomal replication initiator protein DnaA [soil metagenome]
MTLMKPVLWEKAMDRIRGAIGEDAYSAWLSSTRLEEYDAEEGKLLLTVPNDFYLHWIEKRYLGEMETAFGDCMGQPTTIRLIAAKEEKSQSDDRAVMNSGRKSSIETRTAEQQEELFDRGTRRVGGGSPTSRGRRVDHFEDHTDAIAPRLNPRYVFDEFIVGESNRYAHAAGVAVSDPNGKAFNPLFIYGGSGLGKTHLMQAIGHRMYAADNRLRVLYVTSEQFINGFIDAIQNKTHMEFRAAYRNVDLLLIDDVQFLMGKERTQQEFFHTFNALYDAGKKVVVTCDRPPRDLSTLEERLKSRFEWGLLVDIQPPDLETRIAILRKKAEQEGIRLPNDVAMFIAERMTNSVREMEGALKRLRMAASLHDRAINLEIARDVLGHLMVGAPQPRVSVEDVQRAVCTYFGIKTAELLGKNRSKKFSAPRHMAQYLCRKLTELSFPDIAQKFGGKDHTSIIYACRKVEAAIAKDPNMANVVTHLTKQVTKGADQ